MTEKEIEVGEYVRSKIGSIGKVTKIEEYKFLYENRTLITWVGNVIKHSKNIIDLIEVGDIIKINKGKYEVIYDESLDKLGVLIPNRDCLEIRHSSLEHIFTKYEDITILTKEQYMQNCYTVERKE